MKVLIITSDKIDVSLFDAESKIIDWKNANFATNINFSDYDGLVIDADSLIKEREKKSEQGIYLSNLERQFSPKITCDILSQKDSFISIIGEPGVALYQFRLIDLLGLTAITKRLAGTSIKNRCKDGKFKHYWEKINKYQYYLDNIGINPSARTHFTQYSRMEIYDKIKNRSGYIIGACIRFIEVLEQTLFFNGEISLIPPLEGSKQETFNNLLKIYLPYGNTDEPEWIKDISVVGQDGIEKQIDGLNKEVGELLRKIRDLEKEKQLLRKPLEVLYKSNKPLEKTVKYLLAHIGFINEEPKEPNNVEFYTGYKGKKFVIEVKSTNKESFNKDGLRQVMEWQMEKVSESGEKYKPLFIASNQYTKPLAERNKDILPPNLIKFAEQYEICVLPVTVLFFISQLIDEKKYNIKQFADLLDKTNGIVEMPKE